MKEKPKTKTKSKSKSRNKKLDIVYPKSDEEERANRPTWRPQDDPTGTTQQVDVNNLEDFGLSKEELEFKRSCEYLGADYNALKAQEKREAREEKERREAEKAKERREALYGKAKEKTEAKVKPAAMLSFGKGNKRNLSRNVPDQRGDDFE